MLKQYSAISGCIDNSNLFNYIVERVRKDRKVISACINKHERPDAGGFELFIVVEGGVDYTFGELLTDVYFFSMDEVYLAEEG